MDFTVPEVNAGLGPADPANLAARGADPLLEIPNPHFFRRINGITLIVPPGALAAVGTSLHCSLVSGILGPAFRLDSVAHPTVGPNFVFLQGVTPQAFDALINRLEAEPVGVGLNPATVYSSPADAASRVLEAVKRVDLSGTPSPLYTLTPAGLYQLEPSTPGLAVHFANFVEGPSGFTFDHLSGPNGWLVHFGFVSWLFFGCNLSAQREAAAGPVRSAMGQLVAPCQAASLLRPGG